MRECSDKKRKGEGPPPNAPLTSTARASRAARLSLCVPSIPFGNEAERIRFSHAEQERSMTWQAGAEAARALAQNSRPGQSAGDAPWRTLNAAERPLEVPPRHPQLQPCSHEVLRAAGVTRHRRLGVTRRRAQRRAGRLSARTRCSSATAL